MDRMREGERREFKGCKDEKDGEDKGERRRRWVEKRYEGYYYDIV
ncbi:MAG: hypothetical protein ABFE08_22065 [Armatimonadia bacterium]